jgi:3-carboxy-cis,cis-muconate cycloisomerase
MLRPADLDSFTIGRVQQQTGLTLDAMLADFERATGRWRQRCGAPARFMLDGLVLDEGRMRETLNLTTGLVVAEAVMMGLLRRAREKDAGRVTLCVLSADSAVAKTLGEEPAASAPRSH